ncbi:MAG: hypothetical protein JNM39_15445 [Bdellovibrionaceae bacterium]|nr:hypothetical protein [Pseudobdellovibrionaceae bacterium]
MINLTRIFIKFDIVARVCSAFFCEPTGLLFRLKVRDLLFGLFFFFAILGNSVSAAPDIPAQVEQRNQAFQHGLLGAEIELEHRHLGPFIPYIDFAELNSRFGRLPYHSYDFDYSEEPLNLITKDLPLMMPNFLEIIPVEVRNALLNSNSTDAHLPDSPLKYRRSTELYLGQGDLTAEKAITGELLVPSSKITVSDSKGRLEEHVIRADEAKRRGIILSDQIAYSVFWNELNKKWHKVPARDRLRSIPWQHLPHSSKSKLLVLLYSHFTDSDYGPNNLNLRSTYPWSLPDFKPDILDLQFSDATIADLYHTYYIAKDGLGIVEFHTLTPKNHDLFFKEIKNFLGFIGVRDRVLFPGTTFRNDIGFHIHFSSPKITQIEEFVLLYRRMMAIRALAKGDILAVIPPGSLGDARAQFISESDYSYRPSRVSKSMICTANSKVKRIEMRYFLSDVEAEMKELERVSELPLLEVKNYTYSEILKVLNPSMIKFILVNRAVYFFDLLPFEIWEHINLSKGEKEFILDQIRIKGKMQIVDVHKMFMPVKSYVESERSFSALQAEIAEAVLFRGLDIVETAGESLKVILELTKRGVVFQHELSSYNRGPISRRSNQVNERTLQCSVLFK